MYLQRSPDKMGSASFVGTELVAPVGETRVYISIDEKVLSYFNFKNQYREGFSEVVSQLQAGHKSVSILSGDNDKEKSNLSPYWAAV